MAGPYTKLFSSITESTVWCEPMATRIAWITMLAMADKHGRVWASVPGLANRARISLEETETALARFLAPDPYSRTPDHEGRRIEVVDGGWRLLNHAKYRALLDEDGRREYQRTWDREHRQRAPVNPTNPTESDKSDSNRPKPTQASPAPVIKQAGPDGPQDALWGPGLKSLTDAGMAETTARSFIGMLCGQWEQSDVLQALTAAAGKGDPRGYARKILASKPKRVKPPNGADKVLAELRARFGNEVRLAPDGREFIAPSQGRAWTLSGEHKVVL